MQEPSLENALRELCALDAAVQLSFEDRIHNLLRLGSSQFGLELAILASIEQELYTVEHVVAPPAFPIAPGDTFELGSTYCALTYHSHSPVALHAVGKSQYQCHPAYSAFGLESYLAVRVFRANRVYGTLNFSSPNEREHAFSTSEQDLMRIMGSITSHWLTIVPAIAAHHVDAPAEKVITSIDTSLERMLGRRDSSTPEPTCDEPEKNSTH